MFRKPLLFLVLLAVFGSLAAAAIPLASLHCSVASRLPATVANTGAVLSIRIRRGAVVVWFPALSSTIACRS